MTSTHTHKPQRLQSKASLHQSQLAASVRRDRPDSPCLNATCWWIWYPSTCACVCVCVSKKEMLLQRVCILFVCVHAHALAKSIAQSHPTPPTPHAPLLNTFTMQDTSYRSLATVLAGQSTVGTTLKQTYTNAHTHTRIDKRERRQGIRDYCPHMGK